MKYYIEGYGCSLNKADTQAIQGMLKQNGIAKSKLESLRQGDMAVINACAVKETTEKRMLSRIEQLFKLSKKQGFKLIAFGCISKISSAKVSKISEQIIQLPPALEELAKALSISSAGFSPNSPRVSEGITAIIPICRGCLGECSYCAVKRARGSLKSYSITDLKEAFEKEIKAGKKEIWLTAQDCGCYGKDLGTSLPQLLKELLNVEGEYRIRVGMMNVQRVKEFLEELLNMIKDDRVFKFLHLPLQSGNNRVLQLMNRNYKVEEWLEVVEKARKKFPSITIATDIIAGFPTESEKEFKETLQALEKAKADTVNISRYGRRPFTKALMLKDVPSSLKKERSRIATTACDKIVFERNKLMLGKQETILTDEVGKKGGIIGRSSNYKPVVLEKAKLGEFLKVKISKAEKSFLKAGVISS